VFSFKGWQQRDGIIVHIVGIKSGFHVLVFEID